MNKWIKLCLGLLISFAGLYYAFKGMDFSKLLNAFSDVEYGWVAAAMALMVFCVVIRAERWRLILIPFEEIKLHPLFGSTMIGYFGNGVLPFRLGEVLRAYSITTYSGLSPSASFGTIVLERILDMLGLVVLIAFFAPTIKSDILSTNLLLGVGGFSLVIFAAVLWLGKSHSQLHDRVMHWNMFQSSLGKRILSALKNVINGMTALKDTNHTWLILFHTALLWALYLLSVWMVVQSTNIDLSWSAMGIILISTTLAITIPSAPGYVGTYHAAAVYVLTAVYTVGLTEAQAFAVIIHAIGFLPLLVIGAIYFLRGSIRFKDVRNQT